ncbi:hypothetical protein LY78DRAFT_726532 [Colletotrichum sublineola]|nr:hypothetical protein LY78DRAFT_726532 [Colletotrichum sublineola]
MASDSPSCYDVLANYVKDLDSPDSQFSLTESIDLALNAGGIQADHLSVLLFAKSLLRYARDNRETFTWLFKKAKGLDLAKSLATQLYPKSAYDVLKNDSPPNSGQLDDFRVAFFQDNILLTIKVLLEQEDPYGLETPLKTLAGHILDDAIYNQSELDSSETLDYTKQKSVNSKGKLPSQFGTNYQKALDFVKTVKSLSHVARNPEDVVLLYIKGWLTIRRVATEKRSKFIDAFKPLGMTEENAVAMHSAAQRVDCWSEHFWLSMMEERRKDFIPIVPTSGSSQENDRGEDDALRSNNLTDIFQLEDVACEACCSITSLSAYFADLMSLLKQTNANNKSTDTLFTILDKRRPDLKHLHLTCANAQTLIPYISLVNELLESYIYYNYKLINQDPDTDLTKLDIVQAWNTPEDAQTPDFHADQPVYQPGNTNDYVYSNIISKQMYPFTHFPYEKPRDEISQIMASFQVQMPELIQAFRMRQHLIGSLPQNVQEQEGTKVQIASGINEVFSRQNAAETLGIQQAEFSAITNETFFPRSFADLLHGLSDKAQPSAVQSTCSWTAAMLWGYSSTAEMVDEKSTTRLSLIKAELLKRSGLELQDILDLAKSQCFGQDLVIVNESGSTEFRHSLEDLRLLSSSANPPFKDLSEDVCFRLQAFLRLQAKLKWTIRDLDAAIASLRLREMGTIGFAHTIASSSFYSISPYVFKEIASIVELSNFTGVDPASLLPLWGTMDTYGEQSFLYRKFFTPSLGNISKIFKAPKKDMFLTIDGNSIPIRDEDVVICMSLGWPVDNYLDLLEVVNLDEIGETLNVERFSALYRQVLICKILEVAPKSCKLFFKLFYAQSVKPLDGPTATLSAIKAWRKLLDAGWDIESLGDLLNQRRDRSLSSAPAIKDGLRVSSAITQGAQGLRNSFPLLFTDSDPTSQNVAECAARIFDTATAKVVLEYVEGTQIRSKKVSFANLDELEDAIFDAEDWPKKLQLLPSFKADVFEAELKIVGTLTQQERQDIKDLAPNPETLEGPIEELLNQSVAPEEIIQSRFDATGNKSVSRLIETLLGGDADDVSHEITTEDEAEKALILEELLKRQRQKAFVKLSSPIIIQELTETLIFNTVQTLLPDIDPKLVHVLLSNVVKVSPGQGEENQEFALAALQRLIDHIQDRDEKLDAYFTPNASDTFILSYKKSPVPKLTVNGVTIPFKADTESWKPFPMTGGQSYHFVGNFLPSELLWSTPRSMVSTFADGMLSPARRGDTVNKIMAAVKKVARICQMYRLGVEELTYFATDRLSSQPMLQIDLNAPSFELLAKLEKYSTFKQKCSPVSQDKSLIALLDWLRTTVDGDTKEVANQIADFTGWDKFRLKEAMDVKYEALTGSQVVANLRNLDELLSLETILSIDRRLSIAAGVQSQPSMYNLFFIAKSRYNISLEDDTKVASDIQAGLTLAQRTKAHNGLMENQRQALKLKVQDADGLFKHFLIDVQMGPQLRTSRIKQAISVVQLFAQRCLLGLENEVSKTSLVREQWQWRQQYSLWEAHVKMFLYPENWLEPSLRDDKSQLFDDFEATLMKKNLSLDTFTDAIKTYVYGLNEISSLEVVAYIREATLSTDVFHLFGRTRTLPHTFYYRTLTVLKVDTSNVFWRPWTKIDMDIPSVETEWEGKRLDTTGTHLIPVLIGGRLYLFIPQVSPRSAERDEALSLGSKNFSDLNNTNTNVAKPKRIWEITMAWTELSRGSWTPKRVSTGSILLETASSSKPNALRFEPKFESDLSSTKVIILAGYPDRATDEKQGYNNFGGFSFCEDQMISLTAAETGFQLSSTRFSSSTFQQDTKANLDNLSSEVISDGKNGKPLFWIPQTLVDLNASAAKPRKAKSVSWTLSYSHKEGPTSLVMSTKRVDDTSVTYFNVPRVPLDRLRDWTEADLIKGMDLMTLDHTFSHDLMRSVASRVDPLSKVFNILTTQNVANLPSTFGEYKSAADHATDEETEKKSIGPVYHELAQPTALYNWEIGLHSVLLAMDRLSATQQFDEALQVARLVFDPTIDVQLQRYVAGATGSRKNIENKESCWRFPPFQDVARRLNQKRGVNLKLADIDSDKDFNLAIMERRTHGALVHATARGRPEAYMKWIVMKYAEILISAGDMQFSRGTLESLPLAIQRYIEASHILGPEPPKIPKLGSKKPRSYNDLEKEDVKLQLGLPWSAKLQAPLQGSSASSAEDSMVCYLRTTYFCVPLNPKFKQMRGLLDERLFNIRNSLDIYGRPVTYALLEPSIDPGALIALSSQGLGMSDAMAAVLGAQNTPLPRRRFEFLLSQAMDLCNELRGLGERFLGAVEKKEVEIFSTLRARHATAVQKMTLDIKNTSLAEAQQTVESLQMNRDTQASQLAFYLALIGEPLSLIPTAKDPWNDIRQDIDAPTKDDLRMSSYEKMEMDMTGVAGGLNLLAAGIDGLVAPLYAIPDFAANAAPVGVGASVTTGGKSIASAVSAGSAYIKMLAMMAGEQAGQASRKAQLTRQLQDRRLQANIRGREIKSIDKQIEIQKIKVQSIQKEIQLQESEVEEAAQIETWYRSKYSGEQLYAWIEKSIRNIYYQAYTMALDAARKAETALSFEQGQSLMLLRQGGYWDAAHDGLLSAEHLLLDLKRLESSYLDFKHDFEITKTVSLRQIDPLALLNLRIKGKATFSLSENLFDTDFPGHYMRRIRSVAVTIPAIVGPTTGINASLQLTGHQYRISSNVSKSADYAAQNRDSFRTDNISISAIAISSGSQDPGVFELAFSGPKYMPFEGAGAISSWRLELPEVRKFDYESISDVVMHIQYTALDGGFALRSAASETARKTAEASVIHGHDEGFWAMWDLKNDFINEWYDFSSQLLSAKSRDGQPPAEGKTATMRLGNLRDRLPYSARQQSKLRVHNIMWVSNSKSFVKEIGMNGVPTPGNEDIVIEELGKCTMKLWKNLHEIEKLDGWEVTAPTTAVGEGDQRVPNVYMLIRYTYGPSKP